MNFPIPWKTHRSFPLVSLSVGEEKVWRLLVSETLRSSAMSSELPQSPSQPKSCKQGPEVVGSHGCHFKAITTIVHLVETHSEVPHQALHLGGGVQCGLETGKLGSMLS